MGRKRDFCRDQRIGVTMGELIKKYEYSINAREGLSASWRTIYGKNLTEVVETALDKYLDDWDACPDSMVITRKGSYKCVSA